MLFWLSICDSLKLPAYSLLKANENTSAELKGKYCLLGETGGGLYLVMCIRGPNRFRIGVWNQEQEDIDNINLQFSSFTELISQFIHVEDDDPLDT